MTDDDPERRAFTVVGTGRANVGRSGLARANYAPSREEMLARLLRMFVDLNARDAARRAHNRQNARLKRKRRLGSCDPEVVKTVADTIREKHPYTREHSTRWLARKIAKSTGYEYGTVRRRLDDHKIR